MRVSGVWLLFVAVLISALAVIYVRHQHRVAYSFSLVSLADTDARNEEWGQLLLEMYSWSFPHNVEKKARSELLMRPPEDKEITYIKLK